MRSSDILIEKHGAIILNISILIKYRGAEAMSISATNHIELMAIATYNVMKMVIIMKKVCSKAK